MSAYTTLADLGGEPGHGRVVPEPEGELWHAPWEARAMALTVAMGATGGAGCLAQAASSSASASMARCFSRTTSAWVQIS